MRAFFDTNVLIYADDLDEPAKRGRARQLLEEAFLSGHGVLSTQVLQEYFSVATGKFGMAPEVARAKVELLADLDLVQIDLNLILGAIDLNRLHAFSLWDGLIVRAAVTARCRLLYSEDLQHGQVIDGVRIENPFL